MTVVNERCERRRCLEHIPGRSPFRQRCTRLPRETAGSAWRRSHTATGAQFIMGQLYDASRDRRVPSGRRWDRRDGRSHGSGADGSVRWRGMGGTSVSGTTCPRRAWSDSARYGSDAVAISATLLYT